MKMLTEQKDEKKIDWDEVEEVVRTIFPGLRSDLEDSLSNLDIQKSTPFICVDTYPPRISLSFWSKENEFREDVEKELETKQIKLSKIVAKTAKKYGLDAIGGLILGDFVGNRMYKNKIHRGFGDYTFKPKYKEFER